MQEQESECCFGVGKLTLVDVQLFVSIGVYVSQQLHAVDYSEQTLHLGWRRPLSEPWTDILVFSLLRSPVNSWWLQKKTRLNSSKFVFQSCDVAIMLSRLIV